MQGSDIHDGAHQAVGVSMLCSDMIRDAPHGQRSAFKVGQLPWVSGPSPYSRPPAPTRSIFQLE